MRNLDAHLRLGRAGAVLGLLVLLLGAACATTPDGGAQGPQAPVRTSPSPAATAPATAAPTRLPRSPRPPHDTSSPATGAQLRGLVRIVATLSVDGSSETSTGMVLTADGEVVTNHHGVAGARSVRVTVMSTGRSYPAAVASSNARRDVALLRLAGASGLATVTLAAADAAVGDRIAVVGDALGSPTAFVAATGSVVALDQTLVTGPRGDTAGERLTGLVLTTADVVSGDSGGPVYDAHGQVVAMTTAAISTPDGPDGVAIPVGLLREVISPSLLP